MRDAFGSTFMFRILIIFIVLFIVLMCFTVSYAKTFRLKNNVIDIIEHNQYQGNDRDWNDIVVGKVGNYLTNHAYNFVPDKHDGIKEHCKNIGGKTSNNGVCINNINRGDQRYYQVYLYIIFKLPIFNWELAIPVGGETEIIPIITRT